MVSLPKSYILGIAEKPQAARRLAYALDDNKSPKSLKIHNIPVYISSKGRNKIVVAPALGHLFTLNQIGKTWQYPTLDFEWLPTYIVNKKSKTKNFILLFKALAKNAKKVIIMTDFDREGEVIGHLILKLILNKNKCERMKFSTLTVRDIQEAYNNRSNSLNLGFLNSGLLRHYIDWLFGINFSRALTAALMRAANKFQIISIGRVQGPTLRFVTEREKEISLFVPIPYWKVFAKVIADDYDYKVEYNIEKIDILETASSIISACMNQQGQVSSVIEMQEKIYPLPPFNLSDLQREAYKFFRFSPSKTLEIAEKLYLKALISYPRTDSQKLPMTLGHKNILSKLGNQSKYQMLVNEIINRKKYKPYEGKKEDAAHPAIHPTGNIPQQDISDQELKVYDLIVRRYLSVFGEPAIKTVKNIEISVNSHIFKTSGQSISKKGWMIYYSPYITLKEKNAPDWKVGDTVYFRDVYYEQRFTKPPTRYNESTLLREMENKKIGTKATRAAIIKTLFDRGYIEGDIIEPTLLGKAVVEVLEEHYPTLVQPEMTRELEDLMDRVTENEIDINDFLVQIKFELKNLLIEFHKKESEVGISLYERIIKDKRENTIELGQCPKCKVGKLRVIKSKKTGKRFVACSSFNNPDIMCDLTYPLPKNGKIIATNSTCKYDNLPIIEWKIRGHTKRICINNNCVSRNENKNEK